MPSFTIQAVFVFLVGVTVVQCQQLNKNGTTNEFVDKTAIYPENAIIVTFDDNSNTPWFTIVTLFIIVLIICAFSLYWYYLERIRRRLLERAVFSIWV